MPGSGEVAVYYADKRTAIEAGLWLFGLACVALIWWFGSLWRRMVRSEDGAARLAVVSLVGLALAGVLSLASASVSAAVSFRVDESPATLSWFSTRCAVVLLAASGFGVATHLMATSILGARTGTLSWWVVGLGVLASVGFLGSVVIGATGSNGASSAAGVAGFTFWCVWILGVSSSHVERPPPSHATVLGVDDRHRGARAYDMTRRSDAEGGTRRRIAEAALSLFKERDYDDVSLNEIARAAGVSHQTVLNHCENKAGVLLAAGELFSEEIRALEADVSPGM